MAYLEMAARGEALEYVVGKWQRNKKPFTKFELETALVHAGVPRVQKITVRYTTTTYPADRMAGRAIQKLRKSGKIVNRRSGGRSIWEWV